MAQMEKVRERDQIPAKDCWDVAAMYADWNAWDKEFASLPSGEEGPRWPELGQDKVNLEDPASVKGFLDRLMKIDLQLTTLYTYAHLRHDEDVAEDTAKKAHMASLTLLYAFQEEISWFDPSLLQLSKDSLDKLLSSEALQEYHIYLRKIIRMKPYTLSASEERLMALSGKALETGYRAFGSLSNADMKFPPCKDSQGNIHDLTQGSYQVLTKSYDRTLRKEAFVHLHKTFGSYENTLCDLIQGQVERHVFCKKARGYSSCLEAALYPNQVDVSVYQSLLSTVHHYVPALHSYISLRKKLLGYDTLHVYDLNVPIVEGVDVQISYNDAVDKICESVSALGSEYQEILRKGLTEDRWVDIYENARKRSGAYSSGCYGSVPYILMNYHGTFRDVSTLAHEAGHSMHSYFSTKHQKYQDHHYPIFLAEVASTFHEELLFQYLLKKSVSWQEKAYLINQKIDDIRSTLFRQALFAEFELAIHQWGEAGLPVTPTRLKETYLELTRFYFGEDLMLDPEVASEWSRIPHFYYNFYVYQYATGISAAQVLAHRVIEGKPGAKEKYIEFISSGGREDPLTTLHKAGVDMRRAEPVREILEQFKQLTAQLAEIMEKNVSSK
jgi:oligoendopeptidase F